jgi:hypothetical protein
LSAFVGFCQIPQKPGGVALLKTAAHSPARTGPDRKRRNIAKARKGSRILQRKRQNGTKPNRIRSQATGDAQTNAAAGLIRTQIGIYNLLKEFSTFLANKPRDQPGDNRRSGDCPVVIQGEVRIAIRVRLLSAHPGRAGNSMRIPKADAAGQESFLSEVPTSDISQPL